MAWNSSPVVERSMFDTSRPSVVTSDSTLNILVAEENDMLRAAVRAFIRLMGRDVDAECRGSCVAPANSLVPA